MTKRKPVGLIWSRAVWVATTFSILAVNPTASASGTQLPWVTWAQGVKYDPTHRVLYVSGEITSHFADAAEAFDRSGGKVGILIVEKGGSPGGDVEAAVRVGRVLRKQATHATLEGPCASACVLMYAGAVRRAVLVWGNDRVIGLHRPYSLTPSASFQSEQTRVNAYSAKIRQYLTEMNIAPDLYEAMVRVPPEDVRWVNAKELADLGMPEWDPVYMEYMAGKRASELGLSREELNRRLKLRETQCDQLDGRIGPQYCNCVVRIGLYPAGTTCDAAGFPDRPKK